MSFRYQLSEQSLADADRELRAAIHQNRAPDAKAIQPLLRAGHRLRLIPTEEMIEAAVSRAKEGGFIADEFGTKAALQGLHDYLFEGEE